MPKPIYTSFLQAKQQKRLAILIDPDRLKLRRLPEVSRLLQEIEVDYVFVGGSLIVDDQLQDCLAFLRKQINSPIVLFPGSPLQISAQADALLFLSLISGRNPELLIGQHVVAAPYLQQSGLEVIGTGYMLVDGGTATTASYMSHSLPIPYHKPDIARSTAMAAEMLGFRCLYLDTGSGAERAVSDEMLQAVASAVEIPIIVGGGIRTPRTLEQKLQAGADIAVIGSAVEENPLLLRDLQAVVHRVNAEQADR